MSCLDQYYCRTGGADLKAIVTGEEYEMECTRSLKYKLPNISTLPSLSCQEFLLLSSPVLTALCLVLYFPKF